MGLLPSRGAWYCGPGWSWPLACRPSARQPQRRFGAWFRDEAHFSAVQTARTRGVLLVPVSEEGACGLLGHAGELQGAQAPRMTPQRESASPRQFRGGVAMRWRQVHCSM